MQAHDLLVLQRGPAVIVLLVRVLPRLKRREHPYVASELRAADGPERFLDVGPTQLEQKFPLMLLDANDLLPQLRVLLREFDLLLLLLLPVLEVLKAQLRHGVKILL